MTEPQAEPEWVEPDPSEYLPEPEENKGDQDDEQFDSLVRSLLATVSSRTTTRTWQTNLDWFHGQITNRDQSWLGLCQKFSRTGVGAGGGFASAWDQWVGMPREARHVGGDIDDAPIGSLLFTKGDNPHGHVFPAARAFTNGTKGGISTDILRPGWPDRCSRKGLLQAWNHEYLGWGTNMNGTPVDVKDPKPVDTLHYQALAAARDRLIEALDELRQARQVAIESKNWDDRDKIQKEIESTKKAIRRVSIMFKTLRHS